jgi:DNA invertase Pin-like site-specific DNA recombinase
VKDFSRFSRSAMDSGFFIEQVFPLYQVRFISVADHFDSDDYKNDTGGIDVAFKFFMHEYYSADLSKKVSSAKRVLMKNGEYIVANAIYGYRKNGSGKWEPDPEAAEIVRLMFRMALDGSSTGQIRDRLCAEHHPTPKEYIELRRGKDISPQCVWTTRMVRHMLGNEQYMGSYISGKMQSKSIGSHSQIDTDKSAWIIIPDSHPAIVSKKDFEVVQEILGKHKSFLGVKPIANLLLDDTDRPQRGGFISGNRKPNHAIYGYSKDESGLVIDPKAAGVIREIFQMAASGLSIREIRDKLADAGYLIPSEYVKLGKGHAITPTCLWTGKCVRGILRNIQYTGASVSGKRRKNYETGKRMYTAPSDWIVIPNRYPAIVSLELFEEVQRILAGGKAKPQKKDYLLRGNLLKCGCCGYAMAYDDSNRNDVYRCHHTLAVADAQCHKMKIGAAELDGVVLTIIRKQAEIVLNTDNLSGLRKISADGKRIADFEKEVGECIAQRQQVYERFILHEIDRETYQSLQKDISEQIERLNVQIAIFKQAERDQQAGKKAAAIARHTLSDLATPREIVETLVDKILVFPGKRIEVLWKIADFAKLG